MKKAQALLSTDKIVYVKDFYSNYLLCDSYKELYDIVLRTKIPRIFEYIRGERPLPVFFDIDLEDTDESKGVVLVVKIIDKMAELFPNLTHNVGVAYSHKYNNDGDLYKFSCHLIVRLFDGECEWLLENCDLLKRFLKENFPVSEFKGIDYNLPKQNGFLFRTINSSKPDEVRPLIIQTNIVEKNDLVTDPLFFFIGNNSLNFIIHHMDTELQNSTSTDDNISLDVQLKNFIFNYLFNNFKSFFIFNNLNDIVINKPFFKKNFIVFSLSGKCLIKKKSIKVIMGFLQLVRLTSFWVVMMKTVSVL